MSYSALFADIETARAPRPSADLFTDRGWSPAQQAVLRAPFDKSAVVCAGAGAGKTRVLAERVCSLIRLGANPKRMAVVTFTRRAAQEMLTRISHQLGDSRRMPVVGTVHSLAMSVVARRKLPFTLATPEQQLECLAALSEFLPPACEELTPAELLLEVSRAREADATGSPVGMVAQLYEEQLLSRGLGDFTSLLVRAGERPPDMFDHVIVDETQDLSPLQLRLVEGLGPKANFWFIGDPDQSIYSFRGAQAGMMQLLMSRYPLHFTLPTNFRSARRIVSHANNVISQNSGRVAIEWEAHRQDEGSVQVKFFEDGEAEQAFALSWLQERPESRCVLARTRALIEVLKAQKLNAFSVHESKGLEWDEVLVLGCEAALFPHPLAGIAEERRLFYVAMTRARNALILSSAANRSSKNPTLVSRKPSPFLFEAQALQAKG